MSRSCEKQLTKILQNYDDNNNITAIIYFFIIKPTYDSKFHEVDLQVSYFQAHHMATEFFQSI